MSLYQIRNLDLILEKIGEVCEEFSSDQVKNSLLIEFLTKILTKEQESMVTSDLHYKRFYKKIIESYFPK